MKAICFLIGLLSLCAISSAADRMHHYVFFGQDRDRISEAGFLNTRSFEGAQLKYSWRELEHQKDGYDFDDIRHDLAFLGAHDKKLFIQLQDVSFDPKIVPLPKYLLNDPEYHGGANPQYDIPNDDESRATPAGWVARRWDPAVRQRFQKLLAALGKEFDGRIEGINLPETAVDFGESGKLFPPDFTPAVYRDAISSAMTAMKAAFPKSVTMQYANFMPELKDAEEPANLRSIFEKAAELKVGVGGPDLLPYKRWQMHNSYPLIREYAGRIPAGIAVQDGNYAYKNPQTGKQVTIQDLMTFASDYLDVDYIFWCTEEPFYSRDLLPLMQNH